MSTTESWFWVDEYVKQQSYSENGKNSIRRVCEGATLHSLPTETMRRLKKYGYGRYKLGDAGDNLAMRGGEDSASSGGLPTFLHYCQNYKFANHTYAKRKMAHDFFRCDGVPLKLDLEVILNQLDSVENDARLPAAQKKKQMRTAFMICHMIPLMNMALKDYQEDTC